MWGIRPNSPDMVVRQVGFLKKFGLGRTSLCDSRHTVLTLIFGDGWQMDALSRIIDSPTPLHRTCAWYLVLHSLDILHPNYTRYRRACSCTFIILPAAASTSNFNSSPTSFYSIAPHKALPSLPYGLPYANGQGVASVPMDAYSEH